MPPQRSCGKDRAAAGTPEGVCSNVYCGKRRTSAVLLGIAGLYRRRFGLCAQLLSARANGTRSRARTRWLFAASSTSGVTIPVGAEGRFGPRVGTSQSVTVGGFRRAVFSILFTQKTIAGKTLQRSPLLSAAKADRPRVEVLKSALKVCNTLNPTTPRPCRPGRVGPAVLAWTCWQAAGRSALGVLQPPGRSP